MKSDSQTADPVGQKSPLAGCSILVVAALVMIFLIGFSISVLFRQASAIEKFTVLEPVKVKAFSKDPDGIELVRLNKKLEAFHQTLGNGHTASLALTAEEMNLAIAEFPAFVDLRDTFRIVEITEGMLRIQISFPMNGRPRLSEGEEAGWITSDLRYLNGELFAEPGLIDGELVLSLNQINADNQAPVPEEFIAQMSPYRIAERYREGHVIGEVMPMLTDVRIEGNKIVLEHKRGLLPKDTVTNEMVDKASHRLFTVLGIAASLFLLFAAVVIFIGFRLKKKSSGTM